MSNRKPHYFAIGLFVLVGTALAVVGIIAFGADKMKSPKYFIETYLDESVAGVDIGTPFKFRGVKVGRVSKIALVNSEYDTDKMYVMLRVALDPEAVDSPKEGLAKRIEEDVKKGLRVKLVSQGITGLAYLEADINPDAPPDRLEIDWKPKYAYIPSEPSIMVKVTRTIYRLADEINSIDLTAISEHIEGLVSNLNTSAEEMKDALAKVNRIDIEGIGRDIESLSSNLNEAVEEVRQITRTASGEWLDRVNLAVQDLPQISSNLVLVTARTDELLSSTEFELQKVLLTLYYTLDDVHEMVRRIKRYPGLIFSEPPRETLLPGGKK